MARVKIIGNNPGGTIHTFVDGKELNEVSAINFDVDVKDRLPTFGIEIHGVPDIDLDSRVDFSFSPQTLEEAVKVLRHALMTNNDLYNGLVASIESALRELHKNDIHIFENDAEFIADRMIGEG